MFSGAFHAQMHDVRLVAKDTQQCFSQSCYIMKV